MHYDTVCHAHMCLKWIVGMKNVYKHVELNIITCSCVDWVGSQFERWFTDRYCTFIGDNPIA